MKLKSILTVLLLVFVAVSIVVMAVRQNSQQQTEPAGSAAVAAVDDDQSHPARDDRVVVYYFIQGNRCVTCVNIETYAREALETNYADELKSGRLVWMPIVVDNPMNRHFIEQYELVTNSVIISRIEDGQELQWDNLDRIWQLVRNPDAYSSYIRENVDRYLEERQ